MNDWSQWVTQTHVCHTYVQCNPAHSCSDSVGSDRSRWRHYGMEHQHSRPHLQRQCQCKKWIYIVHSRIAKPLQIILKLLRFLNFSSVSVCQAWCYVTGLKDLSKNFVFIRSYLRRLSNPPGFIVCLFVLLFDLFWLTDCFFYHHVGLWWMKLNIIMA